MDVLAIYINEGYRSLAEFPTADFGPYIWEGISQRWLGKSVNEYLYTPKEDQVWNLWRKPSIPLSHRAVLMMTFGRAYIVKADFARAIIDLEAFQRDFPAGKSVEHTWEGIRSLIARVQYPALGFYVHPLTENPFEGTWDKGTQSYRPFDWTTAYDVYAMLKGARGNASAHNERREHDTHTVNG